MNTYSTNENKSHIPPTEAAQRKNVSGTTSQFMDNRPETVAQRRLQEIADNSSQSKQIAQFQQLANNNIHTPVQKKENKTGLPDNLKVGIENLSGYSMDDVKVHYNSDKPAQLQAHAYAQGADIHIASGQEKHLPHEAWHVVQQKQGRVSPTVQLKNKVSINDNAGLEKEADIMGSKALQLKVLNKNVQPATSISPINQVVMQAKLIVNESQFLGQRVGGIKMKKLLDIVRSYNLFYDSVPKPKPSILAREIDTLIAKAYDYNSKMSRSENELHADTIKNLVGKAMVEKQELEDSITPLSKAEAIQEAGIVINYFDNPKSIWGKKHDDLEGELLQDGFTEGKYRGSSDAHEYLKRLSDNSTISVVINYGGGRHTHSMEKKKFDPAFYYKLEFSPHFERTKVIDPITYPEEERTQENYKFVNK